MGQGGWANAVSWLIVLVGWLVVNRQHNNRETRKEVRASLVDLYKHLDQVETNAFSYHTGSGDPLLSRILKRDLNQVVPRIKLAIRGPMASCRYAKQVIAFRRTITLENFDTASFSRKMPSDIFFDSVSASKHDLINILETTYNEAYK